MKKLLLIFAYFMSTLDLTTAFFFDAPPAPLTNFDYKNQTANATRNSFEQRWTQQWKRYLSHRHSGRDDIFLLPVTGDLMIGRENQLSATSTCGLTEETPYCVRSYAFDADDEKQCFRCDSRDQSRDNLSLSHRIESLIVKRAPGLRSWWQSENGVENVSIRLDLESKFRFRFAVMCFKTLRPAAMLIEKSPDFGKTWKVLKYFAEDCNSSFPGAVQNNISCETRFSQISPRSQGRIYVADSATTDFTFTTNLRFNFTKTFDLDQEYSYEAKPNSTFYYYKPTGTHIKDKESNYYAIYELRVLGSMDCNGHASRLVPKTPEASNPTERKVHGKCYCRHNTKGDYCEQCDDMYNDLSWKAATPRDFFECKKCECNNHAKSCHFDPEVYEASGQFSGGVCDNCQHDTMGKNCGQCKTGYHISEGKTISDVDACQPIQE